MKLHLEKIFNNLRVGVLWVVLLMKNSGCKEENREECRVAVATQAKTSESSQKVKSRLCNAYSCDFSSCSSCQCGLYYLD